MKGFYQRVIKLSALQRSVRFLPHVIMGAGTNEVTCYLISRVQHRTLVVLSACITMTASPIMATLNAHESYWRGAFGGLFLSPVSTNGRPLLHTFSVPKSPADNHLVPFTASDLVISSAYLANVQSLAGEVFNEVCQFGDSVGLAVTAAIASSVTAHSTIRDPTDRCTSTRISCSFLDHLRGHNSCTASLILRTCQERAGWQEGRLNDERLTEELDWYEKDQSSLLLGWESKSRSYTSEIDKVSLQHCRIKLLQSPSIITHLNTVPSLTHVCMTRSRAHGCMHTATTSCKTDSFFISKSRDSTSDFEGCL